jgi:hypothetical protein
MAVSRTFRELQFIGRQDPDLDGTFCLANFACRAAATFRDWQKGTPPPSV